MQCQITCAVPIPPELIDQVRDGLRSQLAVAAQRIASADGQPGAREHPERFWDPVRFMDALRALLQELGWSDPPSDPCVVDLQTHGWALTEALQDQLSVHVDMLRDIDRDDERRASIARDMDALTGLALIVLLRVQAQALRETEARPG